MIQTRQRDADFYAACKRELKKDLEMGRSPQIIDVVARVLAGGAPRFYVDLERATRMMYGEERAKAKEKREMWDEIAALVDRRVEMTGETKADACAMVLDGSRASSYFISVRTGRRIFRKMQKLNRVGMMIRKHRRSPLKRKGGKEEWELI